MVGETQLGQAGVEVGMVTPPQKNKLQEDIEAMLLADLMPLPLIPPCRPRKRPREGEPLQLQDGPSNAYDIGDGRERGKRPKSQGGGP